MVVFNICLLDQRITVNCHRQYILRNQRVCNMHTIHWKLEEFCVLLKYEQANHKNSAEASHCCQLFTSSTKLSPKSPKGNFNKFDVASSQLMLKAFMGWFMSEAGSALVMYELQICYSDNFNKITVPPTY